MTPAESLDGLIGEELSLPKSVCKDQKRSLLLQMHRHQHKATRIVNNQGNMTPPKETNKTVTVDPKEMEIYELSDNEFKIILLKKFNKL